MCRGTFRTAALSQLTWFPCKRRESHPNPSLDPRTLITFSRNQEHAAKCQVMRTPRFCNLMRS